MEVLLTAFKSLPWLLTFQNSQGISTTQKLGIAWGETGHQLLLLFNQVTLQPRTKEPIQMPAFRYPQSTNFLRQKLCLSQLASLFNKFLLSPAWGKVHLALGAIFTKCPPPLFCFCLTDTYLHPGFAVMAWFFPVDTKFSEEHSYSEHTELVLYPKNWILEIH